MPYRLMQETNDKPNYVSIEFENTIEEEEFTKDPSVALYFPNQAEAQRFKRHYGLESFDIDYYSDKGWESPRTIRGASKPTIEPFVVS